MLTGNEYRKVCDKFDTLKLEDNTCLLNYPTIDFSAKIFPEKNKSQKEKYVAVVSFDLSDQVLISFKSMNEILSYNKNKEKTVLAS